MYIFYFYQVLYGFTHYLTNFAYILISNHFMYTYTLSDHICIYFKHLYVFIRYLTILRIFYIFLYFYNCTFSRCTHTRETCAATCVKILYIHFPYTFTISHIWTNHILFSIQHTFYNFLHRFSKHFHFYCIHTIFNFSKQYFAILYIYILFYCITIVLFDFTCIFQLYCNKLLYL